MSLLVNVLDRLIGSSGDQRLSILIYHRVLADYDYLRPGDPTVDTFDWQMETLSKYFTPLSLSEALYLLEIGDLPDRAVCVTFDDGYADNLLYALPVLDKWNVPSTVFVATGYLNGGIMWNDVLLESVRSCTSEYIDLTEFDLNIYPVHDVDSKRKSAHSMLYEVKHLLPERRNLISKRVASLAGDLPENLMLTTAQLRELNGHGVEIGAHTHTHPILCKLSSFEAMQEIEASKKTLEMMLGYQIKFFAYPNGKLSADYRQEHVEMVKKCGFSAALTTHPGVSNKGTDRWQLPRFTPWDLGKIAFGLRLLRNRSNVY